MDKQIILVLAFCLSYVAFTSGSKMTCVEMTCNSHYEMCLVQAGEEQGMLICAQAKQICEKTL